VDVICFCIMPTHFHLLLRARKSRDAGNVSNYIHKVLVSHSKYFNTRYERRGHLFESTFHSRHVDTNEYLVYLSRYLHKNPKDIKIWQGRESVYPWSSYQDYIGDNRWRSLLRPEIILKQYDNPREYREYVESSSRDDDDTRRLLTWR
jgi:putative transposase